jgi:hypothetical protein
VQSVWLPTIRPQIETSHKNPAHLWERLKRYPEIHAMHGSTGGDINIHILYILRRAGIPRV